jgi:hypothetical protein
VSHVEGLPASQRRGLAELIGRRFAVGAREGVPDEPVDLFDVGSGLLVDRRAAESSVEHANALRVRAEQLDEAAIETGERQLPLDQFFGRRGRFRGWQLDQAQLSR